MKRLALALVFVASLFLGAPQRPHAQGWGWTPGTAPASVPPSAIAVRFGTALQPIVDALPSTGGILQLDPGRFYADATDSTVALVLAKPVTIIGQSFSGTVMASPITIASGDCHLENMRVRPTGAAYGIKLFISGGGPSRCSFKNMYVGGDSIGDPATPVIGLWLDGAILTTCEQLTIAYCSGDGLYEQSSQLPTWSTNQNMFQNCTFNGNGGWGVHLVGGGIIGTSFYGGNMENNVSGELNASNCVMGVVDGVDFERATAVTNVINLSSSSDWTIRNCNFSMNHSVTRVLIVQSCTAVNFVQNRTNGMLTAQQVAVLDESSIECRDWGNVFADSLDYIRNTSAQQFVDRVGSGWQPPLATFDGLWWMPVDNTGVGIIGTWAKNDGTVTQQTPGNTDLSLQYRRIRWTRTADNQNMGPTAVTGNDCMFWRGDKAYGGGFYFSATFRLDTWGSNAGGGNSTKLFVGLAANGVSPMTTEVDSSTMSGEYIGLYHGGQDKNIFRLLYSDPNTGLAVKQAFSVLGGASNTNVATGEGYQFEMWAPPKGGTIYTKLTSLNRHAVCGFAQTTLGPATNTMLGPQVLMGTGTGGACSMSVMNVYVAK